MKNKKVLVSILAFLAVFALVLGGCSSKKKVTEDDAQKVLDGKVKVPDTEFKTQEEVEALFDAAGLKPKFIVANFDERATDLAHFLREGECNAVEDQPATKYYSLKEVGDSFGTYAEKGAEIIVQYSDHDFDGSASKTEDSKEKTEKESNESKESSESSEKKKSSSSASELPADLTKKLEELNAKYDEVIAQTQAFIDNPETYTTVNILDYTSTQLDVTLLFAELTTEVEKAGVSDWQEIKVYKDVYTKNLTLLAKMAELPSEAQ